MDHLRAAFPTPFPELNVVLQELVACAQAALGGNFAAAYLQGSFALGDFDQHSDVDFIMVVDEELSQAELHALQAMHARIYALDCPWAQHLEGSYFPKEILRQTSRSGEELWYLDHGSRSLVRSDHCNTLVVRWVVRAHGVCLAGPDPAALVDPVPVVKLRAVMLEGMQRWGKEILADPQVINNRFYQSFAVLHYCRLLHDLHTGFPGSKRAGAAWAKINLHPSWSGLIDRAWDGRPNPAFSVRQPADPQDLKSTVDFVRTVMQAGARLAAEWGLEA